MRSFFDRYLNVKSSATSSNMFQMSGHSQAGHVNTFLHGASVSAGRI